MPLPRLTLRHADTSCRSPRDILDHLNRLLTLNRPIAAGSALAGCEVEILTYANTAGLVAQAHKTLDSAIAAGFARS